MKHERDDKFFDDLLDAALRGYTAVVAFYSGFNETYYLRKDECHSTAAAIVRKAKISVD